MLVIDTPVETDRLLLRPFRADDLDDLYAYRSRPDVVRYLYGEAPTYDDVRVMLQRRCEEDRLSGEGDRLGLAAERRDSRRVVGDVMLRWSSVEHRQGEIGFCFHPDVHGRGYATEAATGALDLAFHGLGLHRVYGETHARNAASAGLMRRLGMRLEAHFLQHEIFKGEWGEMLVFAILADEWAQRTRSDPVAARRR